ncbi:MAG TPA: hypothetical protein VN737_11415 [Bryobacteraceae bacterium]|nr:hypothetical protein [Bryobacteraceae bacterium]
MIVLIGQIGGKRIVFDRVGSDPSQCRLLRVTLKRLDVNPEA